MPLCSGMGALTLLIIAVLNLFRTSLAIIEPNITRYLSESPPFLGADVATSIPLSFSNGSLSLWLFGDTITGTFSAGRRSIAAMPRNSVGLFETNKGVPQASFSHFIRYASDPAKSNHTGFWSPDDDSHWYQPFPDRCMIARKRQSRLRQVLANRRIRFELQSLCICHECDG